MAYAPQPNRKARRTDNDFNTRIQMRRVRRKETMYEANNYFEGRTIDSLEAAVKRAEDAEENSELGGHPRFHRILREMGELYSTKHYQYATDKDPMSNFKLCGALARKLFKPEVNPTIAAALLLMSKQIVGVYEIVGENKKNTIESLQDKLRDIGIYSVILQILVEESQ